ncbi:penicillin-binding protein 2 [Hydrogenispora ethanolica]|uniref:Penicillin-binding protein 2 n=2 Tax=Hydrogenispora ethanolica TaxID=1082276 RepID=A0A4R1RW98_HYDET|nr:penicillin-binding protein 2 [Hydrogenispora ethanolica]
MEEMAARNLEHKFKIIAGMVLIIFALLFVRLWVLQIMQGATIMLKSRANQTRVSRINAPRGIFYDRKGKILASSRISHTVSVVPEDVKDKPEVIALLSKILKISENELLAKLSPDPKRPRNPYQFIPISKDLDSATVIKILEAKLDLPGVEVDDIPLRYYPYGEYASHLFGYIREISESELNELKSKDYRLGDLIGKTGLERTYEDYLRGVAGGKIYEVDINGRPLRLLENKEPVPGDNLHLTIDQKVQAAAEKALDDQFLNLQKNSQWRNAKSGAVIALDPRNGNILAMVSKPGFDPNLFTGVITPEIAQKLYNNPLHPFSNRVVQGEFQPGSTFKPITVLAALMEHKVNEKDRFYCSGYDPVWGSRFKCWIYSERRGGHGSQTVVEGLKNSCNIVMAELSRKIGPDTLAKYARYFGLGQATGLNLYPGEAKGFIPDTDWKKQRFKDRWYPLETLHFGIGQGYLTVTPLQLAQVYEAIANGGKVYHPQLVSKITTPGGKVVLTNEPKVVKELNVPTEIMATVREGLSEVISEGTAAYAFRGFPLDKYPVSGKTGTVQKPPYDNSGVFAAYAPSNKPEIVVIVYIEQGGSGSGGAAPVARKILEAYFNLDKKPKAATPAQSGANSRVSPGPSTLPTAPSATSPEPTQPAAEEPSGTALPNNAMPSTTTGTTP